MGEEINSCLERGIKSFTGGRGGGRSVQSALKAGRSPGTTSTHETTYDTAERSVKAAQRLGEIRHIDQQEMYSQRVSER